MIKSNDGHAALRAAIAASRQTGSPQIGPKTSYVGDIGNGAQGIDAASMALLWRLRAFLADTVSPIVQFAPCDAGCRSNRVAPLFARAAALTLGRTLLINAREDGHDAILPDAFVPRLYHQNVDPDGILAVLASMNSGPGSAAGLYSLLVVDQAAPLATGHTASASPLCHGTVLIVAAGATALSSIKAAASRINAMGGVVLGTVLSGAPQCRATQ